MNHSTGIEEEKRLDIAFALSQLLAETYTLYLKTHKYHWNVTGPMFHNLHLMFEQHYTELAISVDVIAERIRALHVKAPGSYTEFIKLSRVKDDTSHDVAASAMIENLLEDHEHVVRTAKHILVILDDANDEGTKSLLGNRIEYHEKVVWMLKSLVD